MISLHLDHIGKKFGRHWVFRDMDLHFQSGEAIAVTGHNGSGKSTLMRVLSGVMRPTAGRLRLCSGEVPVAEDHFYHYVAVCAPQLDIPDEMTLSELIQFHFQFKPLMEAMPAGFIAEAIQLAGQEHKQIRQYSSGMRQRVKLGLALLSDSPILILDEPTTNLDSRGVEWYLQMVEQWRGDKLIFVASNLEREYAFCNRSLHLPDFAAKHPTP